MITAIDLPPMDAFLEGGVGYYIAAMVIFLVLGVFTGSMIWRKGQLQTHDAESEVARTADALERLRQDLALENRALEEGESAAPVLPVSR